LFGAWCEPRFRHADDVVISVILEGFELAGFVVNRPKIHVDFLFFCLRLACCSLSFDVLPLQVRQESLCRWIILMVRWPIGYASGLLKIRLLKINLISHEK
jgi:hypothetical protein